MSSFQNNFQVATTFEGTKDLFRAHWQNQNTLLPYPKTALKLRHSLIEYWISICNGIRLSTCTLHRAIYLFDLYISHISDECFPSLNLKLTLISCLNISVKLNEIHANYTKYFVKNMLNTGSNLEQVNGKTKVYTNYDIIQTESEIWYTVNYSTNYTNVYHINAIFMGILLSNIQCPNQKTAIKEINEKLLKEFVWSDNCIGMKPVNGGILIINKTIQCFQNTLRTKGRKDNVIDFKQAISKIIELKN